MQFRQNQGLGRTGRESGTGGTRLNKVQAEQSTYEDPTAGLRFMKIARLSNINFLERLQHRTVNRVQQDPENQTEQGSGSFNCGSQRRSQIFAGKFHMIWRFIFSSLYYT